ncbi:MAG TPA: hypothetical protein VF017_11370 [Thermoanaerobaculia bacterium]|nr:hypothetical protein [Thermoanaerobaculia bacterium]
MRKNIAISALSLIVLSVLAVGSAIAEPQPLALGCANGPATPELAALKDFETLLALEQTVKATPVSQKPDPGKSGLTPDPKRDRTECEWYWIDCGMDGIDDWCCGSFSSCGSYCEELCGGPCDYYPPIS